MQQKAIFIDRDGVINCDTGHYYVFRPRNFVLNRGIVKALKALKEAGFLLIVITNQGGVDRKIYGKKDVEEVHRYMHALLGKKGVEIDAVYYCPHHDEVQKCLCRKPLNLNLEKAISRFSIDRKKSWMIGDSLRDIAAGETSGLHTLKIESNEDLHPYLPLILTNT